MVWLQVSLLCKASRAPEVSDIMDAGGALAVTVEDGAGAGTGAAPEWAVARITGLFESSADADALREALDRRVKPEPLEGFRVTELGDRDWSTAWMEGISAARFGRRLWVCPSWESPPEADAPAVRLDPGLAFGTGSHPTTALCLEFLDGTDLDGAEVIDFGCGSGILALASVALGAAHVWAVDDDPRALAVARGNAEANGVTGRISTVAPADLPPVAAGVVVANILAKPLVDLAPRLAAHVRGGGRIALSGILAEQGEAVAAAYAGWFALDPPVHRKPWVLLTGRRGSEDG